MILGVVMHTSTIPIFIWFSEQAWVSEQRSGLWSLLMILGFSGVPSLKSDSFTVCFFTVNVMIWLQHSSAHGSLSVLLILQILRFDKIFCAGCWGLWRMRGALNTEKLAELAKCSPIYTSVACWKHPGRVGYAWSHGCEKLQHSENILRICCSFAMCLCSQAAYL